MKKAKPYKQQAMLTRLEQKPLKTKEVLTPQINPLTKTSDTTEDGIQDCGNNQAFHKVSPEDKSQ